MTCPTELTNNIPVLLSLLRVPLLPIIARRQRRENLTEKVGRLHNFGSCLLVSLPIVLLLRCSWNVVVILGNTLAFHDLLFEFSMLPELLVKHEGGVAPLQLL